MINLKNHILQKKEKKKKKKKHYPISLLLIFSTDYSTKFEQEYHLK